jgi:hypothetical protein
VGQAFGYRFDQPMAAPIDTRAPTFAWHTTASCPARAAPASAAVGWKDAEHTNRGMFARIRSEGP